MTRQQATTPVSRRRGPRRPALSIVSAVCLLAASAWAHPVYMDHIEHQILVRVGHDNIDITVELRFNEVQSLAQRRRMDSDRDGRISQAERDRYLRRMRRELAEAFRLTHEGKPLDVIELYAPELDLLGAEGVSPGHHILRLTFFARTPSPLTAPANLEFEDASWPGPPALWLFRATGASGIDLRTPPVATTAPADSEPRRMGQMIIHAISERPPTSRPAEDRASAEASPDVRPAAFAQNSDVPHPSTQ